MFYKVEEYFGDDENVHCFGCNGGFMDLHIYLCLNLIFLYALHMYNLH